MEAAKDYYEALRQRDWDRAYGVLHPDSRARCSAEQFARLAGHYRSALGFEPQAVHVRAYEEHGEEAIVHITFTGQKGGLRKFYKDALALRRNGTAWAVVLPASFGSNRSP